MKKNEALQHQDVRPVDPDQSDSALDVLSLRERQYILLLALGKSRQEISAEMGCAEKTVTVHRSNAASKLGIKTRALDAYAISQGWTTSAGAQ